MVDYATRTSSSGFGLQEVGVGYHHGLTEVVTGEMMAGGGGTIQVIKKVVSLKEYIQLVLAVAKFSVELDYQLAMDLCAAVVESRSLVLDCPLVQVYLLGKANKK